jgi:hypothetical protein
VNERRNCNFSDHISSVSHPAHDYAAAANTCWPAPSSIVPTLACSVMCDGVTSELQPVSSSSPHALAATHGACSCGVGVLCMRFAWWSSDAHRCFASWKWSILTEIHPCHARSYHAIIDALRRCAPAPAAACVAASASRSSLCSAARAGSTGSQFNSPP